MKNIILNFRNQFSEII